MNILAQSIVFFLLFFLPFIIAPLGVTQFEDPKVIIAEGMIIVLFLVWLFSNKLSFRDTPRPTVLFGSIIGITLVDLIFFKTPVSFFGNAFRMQGIFLLWLLLLFSFVSSSVTFDFSPIKNKVLTFSKKNYGWIFVLILFIELIVLFFLPLNASQRYVGTLGEPNALAAFAIFVWPFGWYAFSQVSATTWFHKQKRGLLGKLLLLIFVGCILLLSDSRSAMIALGIQLTFIFLRKFRLAFPKVVVICFLLFVASYALPFFQHDPYENRVEVWQSAFYAGMINPGIGQGFGNVEIALHNASSGLELPIQYYYVDSSHNIFLDWWVAGGVIGLSILLYIVYFAAKRFIVTGNSALFVLLIGMLTVLSFNPASVVGLLGFWWILGQGLKQ